MFREEMRGMSIRHDQGLSELETIEALAVVWAVVNGYQKQQAAAFLRANGFAVDGPKATNLFKVASSYGWVSYDSIFQRAPDELRSTDPSIEILERARKAASDHSDLEDLLRKECPRIFRHVQISFSSHEG